MYGGAKARKEDPREIQTKEFQQDGVQRLITYLMEHEYPGAISPKMLKSPTGSDFAKIVTFLIQGIDPNFEMTTRLNDAVPAVFTALK